MIDGVVIIDKPKGMTSHAAVQRVKHLYTAKKAGHTGTLDPIATGALPICLNGATKHSDSFMTGDKEYEVVILLGVETDTCDMDGKIMKRSEVPANVYETIAALLPEFSGFIKQVPPYFSAVKHKGRPLYKWARMGRFIDLPPRRVEIKRFDIEDIRGERLFARIICSKGTYIRALCRDLGARLGCGACMEELRRLRTGLFHIRDSVSLEDLENCRDEKGLMDYVIGIDTLSTSSVSAISCHEKKFYNY